MTTAFSLLELQAKIQYKLGLNNLEECQRVVMVLFFDADIQSIEVWERLFNILSTGVPLNIKKVVNQIKYPVKSAQEQEKADFEAIQRKQSLRHQYQYRLLSR